VHVSDPSPRPPSADSPSPGFPSTEPPPSDDPTVVLNRLAQLALALIPAFIAALAAIGGATGGLARLLRDETGVAVVSMGLVLLSLAFAALARGVSTSRTPGPSGVAPGLVVRPAVKAALLFGSGLLLFTGLFIAVTAQIGVMGTSQAPQISGSVAYQGRDVVVSSQVKASGVRSVDRITIYSYQTNASRWTRRRVTWRCRRSRAWSSACREARPPRGPPASRPPEPLPQVRGAGLVPLSVLLPTTGW
jgi:hypothetical protein